jgi:predicted DNA-binding transcriptional regulator YafY
MWTTKSKGKRTHSTNLTDANNRTSDPKRDAHGRWHKPGTPEKLLKPRKKHPKFDIIYQDKFGTVTQRIVTVKDMALIDPENGEPCLALSFIGHCHLRKDSREFRIDRVLRMIDLQTGEIVEKPDQHLVQYAGQRY